MQVTIVGLPGSGKTTVFNAITGGHAETGGFSGGRAAPNVNVVKVPDERLDQLSALFKPKKITYADVTYVDVAIPAGAAREGTVNPDVLAQIRNADALVHVVRAFDDPTSPVPMDPWRDVDDLDLEFTVADLTVIEKRVEKLRTQGRHGSQAERELAQRELEVLERIEPHLSDGKPIRSYGLTAEEELLLRGYRFLTQKPVLVVLNIDDGRLPDAAALEASGRDRYAQPHTDVAALAGQIEAEIGELPAEDARLFMDDLGIAEPSRGRVISLTYALLGLFSFFTAGEDECRAWTLRIGSSAVDAAGAIHSDLARGFIRAETIGYGDLLECGSMVEARKRG
ncbi:MAG: YchF family ATPase, partial [Chloroflexota bacterium]|nr:YchF family ATPase [Chloroflexota bacterium]